MIVEENVFGFVPLRRPFESVIISDCYRCHGGMILWQRKENVEVVIPELGVTVWHFRRSKKPEKIQNMTERLLEKINHTMTAFSAIAIFRCGGKINTAENVLLYVCMKEYLEKPVFGLFLLSIQGVEPTKNTICSSLYLDENLVIHKKESLYREKL